MKKWGVILGSLLGAVAFILLLFFVGRGVYHSFSLNKHGDNSPRTEEKKEEKVPESIDVEKLEILTEDEVNMEVEDAAIRDVEQESTYVNSMELLPSLKNERATVSKNHVRVEDFPKSFASDEQKTITITSKDGKKATIAVPKEVTIFPVAKEESATIPVQLEVTGDKDLIKNIGLSSSDSSRVQLSENKGTETTLTCVDNAKAGDCSLSIYVSYQYSKKSKSTEEMSVRVHVDNMADWSSPIYDDTGAPLYLDAEGQTVARICDYVGRNHFYGDKKTMGWQEADGHSYYYSAAGIPVTGLQRIGGITYTFDDEGVLIDSSGERGIDVSRYQKDIDWNQVASSGVSFAIIRCGFRGAVGGNLVTDAYFKQNIERAKAAGVRVGVYFFTQAITETEAAEEAAMALSLCEKYSLDLPIFIDSEGAVNGRANDLDAEKRTRILKSFCDTVTQGGRAAGVYASKSWYEHNLHAKDLEKYVIWVAQYNTECTYYGKIDYWQYSSKEQIPGIVGDVDVDVIYTKR